MRCYLHSAFCINLKQNNMKIFYHTAAAVMLLVSCTSTEKNQPTPASEIPTAFINPPLKNVDVPFKQYSFSAGTGDTIFYQSGSILLFPPSAFVDKDGIVVTGKVTISYREFAQPIDFFLSGITMDYDSANTKYRFESSAMCEVNAFNSEGALYVNPKAKPEINLASSNNSTAHNLYFLDTIQRKWIYKGKDTVTAISQLATVTKSTKAKVVMPNETVAIVAPVKPVKAGDKQPVIAVKIEPGSVPELQAYDNLKFEVDAGEKSFNAADAATEWQDIKVDKENTTGKYRLTFTSTVKKVSYAVRPVFEGEDYDKAMKVFDEKNREYERLLAERKIKAKENKEAYEKYIVTEEKLKKENDRILKLNALVEIRNKEIEKENINVATANKKTEEENARRRLARLQAENRNKKITDSLKKEMAILEEKMGEQNRLALERMRKQAAIDQPYEEIFRTFTIGGFGVWNCDHPQIPGKEIPLAATFKDEKESNIDLINPVVVYKSFNSITRFYDNNIRVIPGTDNMIWAMVDDKFAYLTYEDYRNCTITASTKQYTFIMRLSPQQVNSYEEIKKLVGQ